MRLPRAAFCLFLAGGLFVAAGCAPADPLEWKVSAQSPQDFNLWLEKTEPKLPPDVRSEFSHAFTKIAGRTPSRTVVRHMNDRNNELCRRVHGRTLRAVILDGYAIEKQSVLERIGVQSDLLLKNANRAGAAHHTAQTEAKFARVMEAQNSSVEALNKRLAEIDARVGQLSPAPK